VTVPLNENAVNSLFYNFHNKVSACGNLWETAYHISDMNKHPLEAPIEYTVHLRQPQTQTVDIQMRIRKVAGETLYVALPVWRPGRYDVLNLASGIRNLRAAAASGESLSVAKIDKTTWQIATAGHADVIVTYGVYANSLSNRTRHVDDTHAFLSGAAVFLYVPERRMDSTLVHVDAPAGWKVATGLEPVDGNPRVRYAEDYDVLVDSPFEIGEHRVTPFEIDGKSHEIVIWGDAVPDHARLVDDFSRIVRSCVAIFGNIPYSRYVFLVHVSPDGRGGTEHLNSTIMQTSLRSFQTESGYRNFLGLVSHEIFHTWNVKQFRPSGIRFYDYTKENYTDLLWVAEGATSYYDDLILVRSGIESPDWYLTLLGNAITAQRKRPGSRVQSLVESSFDAWIRFNHPTPDDVNSTVSFYETGALASLLLDMELRQRTSNRISLDNVMREMYLRFPRTGPGYTLDDLRLVFDRLSATSFQDFFNRYIGGTETFPFERLLRTVGIEVRELSNSKAYAGINLSDRGGTLEVVSVPSDGPAYGAGVNAGDQIVAVDGRQLSATEFDENLSRLGDGRVVHLQILRRGRMRSIDVTLSRGSAAVQLTRSASATEVQRNAYESWLKQSWIPR
jgi:predicted metalloprotease with PDZ domain